MSPKKTHVERKSPRISLARLADYMAASEQGKRSIAVTCKYQPIGRLIQYNDAKVIISNYIRSENRKIEDLKEKLQVLKNKICDSDFEAEVRDHNADCIARFIALHGCFVDGKWSIKPLDPGKGGVAKSGLPRHKELTKDGIAHFRARTGSWGRKPFVTTAHIEKFREVFDRGSTVVAAARAAGISNAYFYMHREAISAWKKGDPWPPPGGVVNEYRTTAGSHPTEANDDQPKLKVVSDV